MRKQLISLISFLLLYAKGFCQKGHYLSLEVATGVTAPIDMFRVHMKTPGYYDIVYTSKQYYATSANTFRLLYGQKRWMLGLDTNINF